MGRAFFLLGVGLSVCFISVNRPTDLKQSADFVPRGLPVAGEISSGFGLRRHPVWRRRHFHKGMDIRAALRTPVRATARGRVAWSGTKPGYGRCVVIDHGHGWETVYAHLRKSFPKTGDAVSAGERIGNVGATGIATGPHLHYEVIYQGVPMNPEFFRAEWNRPTLSRLENSSPEVFSPLN